MIVQRPSSERGQSAASGRDSRHAFSFGGCGANVSSHSTGAALTLRNAWTQPTPVQKTLPGFARYTWPSAVASTSPLRMK